jgi:hypothetical protein
MPAAAATAGAMKALAREMDMVFSWVGLRIEQSQPATRALKAP